ncbi:MAG TPA: pyrroloquinoline quinone-dependent dehydrogenase [Burkholderiaceae bacterium]|nr:pyrroloquinoline quinone-dependent dehydrogenase [Burkholderiaceae bacterium]
MRAGSIVALFSAVAFAAALAHTRAHAAEPAGWAHYGGDAGGTRYSASAQITPANVDGLRRQWLYRTGDVQKRDPALMKRIKFETTPILVDGALVLCSSFNEVIALDPGDGHERWRFDPKVATDRRPANRYNCRGVAQWRDPRAAAGQACATRIFSGTVDARVIALDARDGKPCADFGEAGTVRIDPGRALRWPGEFQISSAPVVADVSGDGIVVVGSSINDNGRADTPSGRVRAFDARSGALRWSWDPLAPDVPPGAPSPAALAASQAAGAASAPEPASDTGAANVWAPMSIDEKRGLVFLPTSSPSPDFYGGQRPGLNGHADSVVALRVADGALAWAFQVVKHDVWDYDLPAQPTLATLPIAGKPRDVVIQATKQGFVFVLDRDTGKPLFPVEERAVPQGGAPGEVLSPTQTYPADLPALVPQTIKPDDAYGSTWFSRDQCRERLAALRNEGLYTPPSTQGTVLFPMTGGGVNWGGVAVDPQGVVYVNTSRVVHVVTLIPRAEFDAVKAANPNKEVSPQFGTPFGMKREVLVSSLGAPCNPTPWGTLAALDLRSKTILWERPLGTTEEIAPLHLALPTGTPNLGGPVATAGGLVFIGAAMDRYLRAFDAASGAELWRGQLPAAGMATPMTYEWQGRQFVVVAAGGHGEVGAATSDAIVAFALPAPGEAPRSWWDRSIAQPGASFQLTASAATLLLLALIGAGWWWRRSRRRRRAPR